MLYTSEHQSPLVAEGRCDTPYKKTQSDQFYESDEISNEGNQVPSGTSKSAAIGLQDGNSENIVQVHHKKGSNRSKYENVFKHDL